MDIRMNHSLEDEGEAEKEKPFFSKKKIIAICVIAAILICTIVYLLLPQGYLIVKLIETGGQVSLDRGDQFNIPIYDDMNIQAGDFMRIGPDRSYSRLVLDNDKYVYVEEKSEVAFDFSGNKESSRIKINLNKGAILNEIETPLGENSTYEVRTPNALMAVRGTRFRISVYIGSDGILYTRASVLDGKISCRLVYPDGTVSDEYQMSSLGNEALIYYDKERGDTDFVRFDSMGGSLQPRTGEYTRNIRFNEFPDQILFFMFERNEEDGITYAAIDKNSIGALLQDIANLRGEPEMDADLKRASDDAYDRANGLIPDVPEDIDAAADQPEPEPAPAPARRSSRKRNDKPAPQPDAIKPEENSLALIPDGTDPGPGPDGNPWGQNDSNSPSGLDDQNVPNNTNNTDNDNTDKDKDGEPDNPNNIPNNNQPVNTPDRPQGTPTTTTPPISSPGVPPASNFGPNNVPSQTPETFNVIRQYKNAIDGTTIQISDSFTETVEQGANFTVYPIDGAQNIAGYRISHAVVEYPDYGIQSQTVNFVPAAQSSAASTLSLDEEANIGALNVGEGEDGSDPVERTVTIKYVDENGNALKPEYVIRIAPGDVFELTDADKADIDKDGRTYTYEPSKSTTEPDENGVVTLVFARKILTTVNYVNSEGSPIRSSEIVSNFDPANYPVGSIVIGDDGTVYEIQRVGDGVGLVGGDNEVTIVCILKLVHVTVKFVDKDLNPIPGKDDVVLGVYALGSDITTQVKALTGDIPGVVKDGNTYDYHFAGDKDATYTVDPDNNVIYLIFDPEDITVYTLKVNYWKSGVTGAEAFSSPRTVPIVDGNLILPEGEGVTSGDGTVVPAIISRAVDGYLPYRYVVRGDQFEGQDWESVVQAVKNYAEANGLDIEYDEVNKKFVVGKDFTNKDIALLLPLDPGKNYEVDVFYVPYVKSDSTPDGPGSTPPAPDQPPSEPPSGGTTGGTTPSQPGTTPNQPGTTPNQPGTTPHQPSNPSTPTQPQPGVPVVDYGITLSKADMGSRVITYYYVPVASVNSLNMGSLMSLDYGNTAGTLLMQGNTVPVVYAIEDEEPLSFEFIGEGNQINEMTIKDRTVVLKSALGGTLTIDKLTIYENYKNDLVINGDVRVNSMELINARGESVPVERGNIPTLPGFVKIEEKGSLLLV